MNYLFVSIFFIICFSQFIRCKILRDPFFLPSEKKVVLNKKKEESIGLVGIIKIDNKLGVILKKGERQEVAFVDSNVWGYKVKNILEKQVILKKGEEEFYLHI